MKIFVLWDIGFGLSGGYGIFRDLFLRVKDWYFSLYLGLDYGEIVVVICLDVMFYMYNFLVCDEEFVNFVNKYNIKKIVEVDGIICWFGCWRGLKYWDGEKCFLKLGLVVLLCCLENIVDVIKFVME